MAKMNGKILILLLSSFSSSFNIKSKPIKPFHAKLYNLDVHPLEAVSR